MTEDTRPASDVLSLTLPRAGVRKRIRRRFRPPRWFWWYLAWALICAAVAALDLVESCYVYAGLLASAAAFYWRCAMRVKDGRPVIGTILFIGAYVAVGVATLITGVR